MDDLELEARLRTHLHRRFDDGTPSPDLAEAVRQGMTTAPRPVGFVLRARSISLGWAALAAGLVLAVAALGIGKVLGPTGPGAHPTPGPTADPGRTFVVLPPETTIDKAAGSLASDVMSARLQALGVGNFSSGGGYGIEFVVPTDGPSDAAMRAVLTATGDVRFVPLPAADYGAGKLTATLGAPLPKDEPALFGWEGIASFTSVAFTTFDGTPGAPLLAMTPKAPAAQAFADFVEMNPGATYAIVVDDKVALLPTAQPAVADGSINVSNGLIPGGSEPTAAYYETAAILVGGELPEAWRGASVPVLISREEAIATALVATQGGTVKDASLSVDLVNPGAGSALQVAWNIAVFQPECQDNKSCVNSDLSVAVDAVTGTMLHIEAQ